MGEVKKGSYRRKKNLIAYSFIAPNFIGFFILTFIPIIFSFVLSVCEWDAGNSSQITFVGLANFQKMLTDSTFKISFKNTIVYTIGVVPSTLILSLLLAMLMNCKIKGRTFFRSVIFFPYVASLVAVGVVWNALFHPDNGPVNQLLMALGVQNPPRWAADIHWAMPTLILLSIWKNVGYYTIVYLAALQGVPGELYEASKMDGANAWQRFKCITWPMVTPSTFFVAIMLTIYTFKVFDMMYITTQGGPGRATNVLVYHLYNQAFISLNFGYASAIAMVLFVIILVITLFQFRFEKKFTSYL
ncbi:MAG: sugar ABC transporter permease [bacterium]|nr:sugar ABC transporter permease [bacterium]